MNIRSYIAEGRPLLFDGAMGTCFASLPGHANERCEQANLEHPEEILAIHKAYLDAGCRAIKTNTFSVSEDYAQGNDALGRQIIEAGCRLAKKAADAKGAFIFADLGPAHEGNALTPAELYCRQTEEFLRQGVTNFLAETMPSDEGIPELARYLKANCPESFLIVSFAVNSDGMTREGQLGIKLYKSTAALPEVDAVGFNCIAGPGHMLKFMQKLELCDKPLSIMPNAGYPTVLGRRTVYQDQPDYFAQKLTQIVHTGASIVGGCCGTTPAHIAAAAAALRDTFVTVQRHPAAKNAKPSERATTENQLFDKLACNERVIAVELDPPIDDNISDFLIGVQKLQRAGVDAVTIADCPVGRPRADSSLLACKIKRELGIEPLPHITCRDRNLNAIKALLLGLSIEGVHNILVVTGDPIPSEDRNEVKSVFNFNSRKLASYISALNASVLTSPFRIFGALNVNAKNFDMQLSIAKEKEKNGVSGFLTQPILSERALENLKQARKELHGRILGGIYPVVSYKNACFMNNEIAGIDICPEIVALYEGKDREESERIAIAVSTQIAREIKPYTDGVYLMTPFKRVELVEKILKKLT